jgi:hypothetical protein
MGKNIIYGADITKKVTPTMVRDAIVDCFINAHKSILDEMKEYKEFKSEKEFEAMKKINVKFLIEKTFSDVGGDFNNPNKATLLDVISSLKEYSANFRKPKIIEKHTREIMQLINKLD